MSCEKKMIPGIKGLIASVIHHSGRKTKGLAIICPGYLDSKDHPHLIALADMLAEEGYVAVRFDPSGTWESEGDIFDYTTTQYLDDVRAILDEMLRTTAYRHVFITGHSRGGMISILSAARDPRITSVAAIMPSTSRTITGPKYEKWRTDGFSVSRRRLHADSVEREFRVPYSHVEDRARNDVPIEAERVHVPMLLLAGGTDDLVKPEFVKEIYTHANEPKTYLELPGMGHDYRYSESEVAMVNESVKQFLRSSDRE
jgi:uncharacterized protein